MILTTCAACAAPLAHDAPRCVRCQTRYCNKTCQHDHGWLHASAHFRDPGATLDDVREAVATLEDSERTARRVMGGAHPLTGVIERELRSSRMLLSAREASDSPENS